MFGVCSVIGLVFSLGCNCMISEVLGMVMFVVCSVVMLLMVLVVCFLVSVWLWMWMFIVVVLSWLFLGLLGLIWIIVLGVDSGSFMLCCILVVEMLV